MRAEHRERVEQRLARGGRRDEQHVAPLGEAIEPRGLVREELGHAPRAQRLLEARGEAAARPRVPRRVPFEPPMMGDEGPQVGMLEQAIDESRHAAPGDYDML
jgi:hypothetical protein